MNPITRRQFLQFAGGTFASLGLSQLDFFTQAENKHRLLAQPTGRKLALLVGINQYQPGINTLKGCLTDMELQYELLRHRYGFNPADIMLLTDNTPQKPTRDNILAAFENHLIQQAKPGDVVIFHYSGHGSLLIDPNPLNLKSDDENLKQTNGTIIPADCTIDNRNDIMGKTLFLLSSQIKTDLFTMVLDSCHAGGGTRGNQVVRATTFRADGSTDNPSQAELNYQDTQRGKLKWSSEEFQTQRKKGIAKGVALGAAQKNQLAIDASFGAFNAGAFTYLLTRYLWQLPGQESLSTSFDRLSLVTKELADKSQNAQIPTQEVAAGQKFNESPVFHLAAVRPSAEAVIQKVEPDGKITFWLGGISSQSLEAFQPGSLFSMIDDQSNVIGEIKQTERSGLVGYGVLTSGVAPKAGILLREKLRNIPTDITLKVALDDSLGKQREAIAQVLKKSSYMQVVPLNQKGTVDFIISRLSDTTRKLGSFSEPNGSIGIFNSSKTPIAKSFGRLEEAPETTVARLRPQLKMLLAKQFLNLTLNGTSSQLKVNVDIKSQQGNNIQVLARGGGRSIETESKPKPHKDKSILDVNIQNKESSPIYLAVLSINSDGVIDVLHPVNWDSPESASIVKPNDMTKISIEVFGPAGFFEVMVITSASPLRDTLRGLQTIALSRGLTKGEPLTFDGRSRSLGDSEDSIVSTSRNLISDLRTGARVATSSGGVTRGLDAKQSGIFSAILEVIE
jgi:hypothetical protein